ncbi:MAG: hypothetical protein HUU55_20260 [Myxococcales bacterium]|nr:hypothetical protein [Myxococcales bacterium]
MGDPHSEKKDAQEQVRGLLTGNTLDLEAAESAMDALPPDLRLALIRTFSRKFQADLFEAAKGRRVTLAHIVPAGTKPLVEVIHEGKNTLPAFTQFQKRFCRSPLAPDKELWGYNHQTMAWATGPGYFVAFEDGNEIAIDYTKIPPSKPETWPAILRNDQRLSRFVYNGTIDYLRRVSAHVTIGRATRANKPMDAWFVLCRQGK